MTVILEDDSDVHVDHDQKADDQVGEQKGDGHDGVAAVTLISGLGVGWKKLNIYLSMWLLASINY